MFIHIYFRLAAISLKDQNYAAQKLHRLGEVLLYVFPLQNFILSLSCPIMYIIIVRIWTHE